MKIDKKVLSSFIKKIRMDEGQEVKQCLFDFRESGIYVNAMSDDNCTMVIGQLFKDAFMDYTAIGDVGLDELKPLSDMIYNGFDDTVTLKKEGTLLVLEGTYNERAKKIEIPLLAEDFVRNKSKEPALSYTTKVSLTQKDMKGIFQDIKSNREFKIIFKTVPQKFSAVIESKYKYTVDFDMPAVNETVSSKFSKPFYNAVCNLNGDVELSIARNYPATILERVKDGDKEISEIKIIVAPVVSDDD